MTNVPTLRVPECAACRALCCRVSVIPLDPRYAWDRSIIAAGDATLAAIDGQPSPVIARQASGSCQYLDEATDRCSIYARRPYVCRTWGCLSREDAFRLGMTAVEEGIDPRKMPPLQWLRTRVRAAWRLVDAAWKARERDWSDQV
ncbi:MAG: hypothetical protein GEEBNDBF_01897 [bacterium]|nr:hypothetical protein [bacterium]